MTTRKLLTEKVVGQFEVNMNPVEAYAQGLSGITLARMTLDKTFSGGLNATSKGEMLSAMTGTSGSAGYVAIEQVSGTLSDKTGGFVLQHFGIMDKGRDRLVLEVVPDSGTGALVGLTGTMQINREEGQHHYEFDFCIAD